MDVKQKVINTIRVLSAEAIEKANSGVSDMIASSMYNSTAGSGVWEKNLDRLTIIMALIFGLCICVMALTFPLGVI